MCELLAISTNHNHQVNDTLKTFFERSEYNPHGWGLAYYNNKDLKIHKEPIKAIKSQYLKRQLKRPIIADNLLGHVRFATVGQIDYNNCHPFHKKDKSGCEWVLIHNGTLFKEKEDTIEFKNQQAGLTDSERILLKIVDLMNNAIDKKQDKLDEEERFEILSNFINKTAQGNKLNIIISDGDLIYVHTNCKDQLNYSNIADGLLVSTNPLNFSDYELNWHSFPFKQLIGIKDGKIKFEGKIHDFEYIEDPEVNRLLYLKYANL